MKYGIGQELILLRKVGDGEGGHDARPFARATVLGFNGNTDMYKVSFVEFGSEKQGMADVQEELLVAPLGFGPGNK